MTSTAAAGEKVPGPDPAAAPLGSDDEAAGETPSLTRVELTGELEANMRRNAHTPQRGPWEQAWHARVTDRRSCTWLASWASDNATVASAKPSAITNRAKSFR